MKTTTAIALLLLLAQPARAQTALSRQDFADLVLPSSLTVSGTLTVFNPITTTGTITANRFVGDGSAVTGVTSANLSTAAVTSGAFGDNRVAITTGAVSGTFGDDKVSITTGALAGILPVAKGGTGAATAAGARTSLGAAASGANADISSLAGSGSGLAVSSALTITGASATVTGQDAGGFGLSVAYGVRAGSAALTGGLTASSGTFTQTTGYSVATSSGVSVPATAGVYAGFFVGNGAGLTGTSATDNTKVLKAGDTMTGQLTLSGSSLTVTGGGGVGVTYGLSAATGAFTATGANYSVTTSSGVSVPGTAGVYAGFFAGNGAALTNVSAGFAGGAVANATTFASSVTINGAGGLSVAYGVSAGSAALTSGLTASSGTFLNVSSFSVTTSSGILVSAGGVLAHFVQFTDDNTVMRTAASGNSVWVGTYTYLTQSYSTTSGNLNYADGIAVSSVSFNLPTAGRLHVDISASMRNSGVSNGVQLSFLIDGLHPAPYNRAGTSTNAGVAAWVNNNAATGGASFPAGIHITTEQSYGAGPHDIILVFGVSAGGTATLDCDNVPCPVQLSAAH